jgi:predicted RNA-binding protein YlxR (DUF448 family)
MLRKHVPQRTCVVCRRVRNKRDLIRVVRTADAGVVVDLTGKRAGRGAYLCRDRACWETALAPRSRVLDHALKTPLSETDRRTLIDFAQTLPGPLAAEDAPPSVAGADPAV